MFKTKGDAGFIVSRAGATLSEMLAFSVLSLRTGVAALACDCVEDLALGGRAGDAADAMIRA
jgi:hypothetical protein